MPDGSYIYKASAECPDAWKGTWKSPYYMTMEAARIFLRVTGVRVERLHKITTEDYKREGATPKWEGGGCRCSAYVEGCMDKPCPNRSGYEEWCYAKPFTELWNRTIKPADRAAYGWDANPWVWVISFVRINKAEAIGRCAE